MSSDTATTPLPSGTPPIPCNDAAAADAAADALDAALDDVLLVDDEDDIDEDGDNTGVFFRPLAFVVFFATLAAAEVLLALTVFDFFDDTFDPATLAAPLAVVCSTQS